MFNTIHRQNGFVCFELSKSPFERRPVNATHPQLSSFGRFSNLGIQRLYSFRALRFPFTECRIQLRILAAVHPRAEPI